uniref:Potassium channel domain-containing protein n=1 Tax=Ditylenchus dipsaci TaxID=166011 RepID=A0A915CPK5_9BILA
MEQQEEDLLPAQQKSTRRKRSPIWLVCFQLLVVLTCCIYILLAALIYRKIDPKLGEEYFTDVVLFCFTTIATIGYGNMHPSNTPSMLFTIAYSLLGIPLFMFTLGSLAKSLTRGFWFLANIFDKKSSPRPSKVMVDRLPLPALLFMFTVMLWITALLFQNSAYYRGIVIEDIYFCIVSLSTVGFGDLFATASNDPLRLVKIIVYIALGMMLLGIWFTIVREYLKKLYSKTCKNSSTWSRIAKGEAHRGKHFLHATSQNITPQSIHLYDFECLSQNEFERH